jgi:hypothetical protein
MTTVVRHSPSLNSTPAVRGRTVAMAEVRSISSADPLHQEADLLARGAKTARERGLAADAELARWLERSMLRMWAGGSGAPEHAAALSIAQALTAE